MKLTFWGAAGGVTGSMHQVEAAGRRLLLDCGLNQGRRQEADRKNRKSESIKNEWDGLVDGMGFEPTTPALRTPCSPN